MNHNVILKTIDTKGTENKNQFQWEIQRAESMSLTELPFHLPGRIFRSPMPFSVYDPRGDSLLRFKREKGSLIPQLSEKSGCFFKGWVI